MFVTPGGRATTEASAATRIWFCAAVSTLYIGFVITAVAGTAITIGAGDGVGLCAWIATAIKAVVIASAISFVFMLLVVGKPNVSPVCCAFLVNPSGWRCGICRG